MEIILRFLGFLLNALRIIIYPIVILIHGFKRKTVPPIKNDLLKIAAIDLAKKIRNKELKSEDVVRAYIERINEINPYINAVIEDRYEDAIKDAQRADQMCKTFNAIDIEKQFPLLGVPFTVKESVGLKGLSHVVGSSYRIGYKAIQDGTVVERLKASGCIPLLVSNNPEFCYSWETNNLINGLCKNPYDFRKTTGGSSGGEGALIGSGASLFGVGSDVAGSIRVPALYNGIFGHKPTGTLLSTEGHFPNCTDPKVKTFLQVGPMCRYAKDLPILMQIMAGDNANKLHFDEIIYTKDINIFYMEDINFSFTRNPCTFHIQLSILRAVEYLKRAGLKTERASIAEMSNLEEITFSSIVDITDAPNILVNPKNPEEIDNFYEEIAKHIFQKPKYSFLGLFFNFLFMTHGFIPKKNFSKWSKLREIIRIKLLEMLGKNGVLFFPTLNNPALYHNMSPVNLFGFVFPTIWNVLGFPATHIPMGLDNNGLPVGFQIIAAPYQDKLCLQIAAELEVAFGGWKPPSSTY